MSSKTIAALPATHLINVAASIELRTPFTETEHWCLSEIERQRPQLRIDLY
jgi:hypothetical protein